MLKTTTERTVNSIGSPSTELENIITKCSGNIQEVSTSIRPHQSEINWYHINKNNNKKVTISLAEIKPWLDLSSDKV